MSISVSNRPLGCVGKGKRSLSTPLQRFVSGGSAFPGRGWCCPALGSMREEEQSVPSQQDVGKWTQAECFHCEVFKQRERNTVVQGLTQERERKWTRKKMLMVMDLIAIQF